MAGRPRKPTKQKILQGTFRKHRSAANEPDPPVVDRVPAPPRHLSLEARKLWKHLARRLKDQGLLTALDLPSLEILVFNWGLYQELRKAILKRSRSFSSYLKVRNSQTALEYTAMKEAFRLYKAFAVEFGLSPAARSRIDLKVPKTPVKDPMEGLLNEG
jgi:P27 family predicted phage terminase small subunit